MDLAVLAVDIKQPSAVIIIMDPAISWLRRRDQQIMSAYARYDLRFGLVAASSHASRIYDNITPKASLYHRRGRNISPLHGADEYTFYEVFLDEGVHHEYRHRRHHHRSGLHRLTGDRFLRPD